MKKGLFKRISALLLVLLTVFSLTACVDIGYIPTDEPTGVTAETEVQTEAETDEETTEKEEKTSKKAQTTKKSESTTRKSSKPNRNGSYTSKNDVAAYIHAYGKLPGNFITKKKAQSLGWSGGSLEKYAPGKCIGGDYFGNYQNLLPKASGRKYYECDIDTLGKSSRGAKRIIYSNDGLIFYTSDHYESFTQLY